MEHLIKQSNKQQNISQNAIHTFRYYWMIAVAFVVTLCVSNTIASKLIHIGPFIFTGAIILFPVAYIFGDILTEVYGYTHSRKIVWAGFFALIFMSLLYYIVGMLPAAPGWTNQSAYDLILGFVPRIVLASMLGYWTGEFVNSYILAKMKILTSGKYLWMRTISSTIFGEGVDTVVVGVVAFYGVIPNTILAIAIASGYLFKVVYEIIATPLTYAIVRFLKEKEHIDVYDYKTDFNPFKIVE